MNLKNFFNKVLNHNRIYTREDIGAMNSNEFSENEKAIDYQLNNLGVPTNADMNSSSDVVYVHSYTRDDGTNVKAHIIEVKAESLQEVQARLITLSALSYKRLLRKI